MGSTRERDDERGFTLIELMIVIAIIAVLAVVVVPTFIGEAKKVSAKSEVTAWFAELAAKQDRYKNEAGAYLDFSCTHSSLTNQAQTLPTTTCTTTTEFTSLGIIPPTSSTRCNYVVETGAAGADPSTAFKPDGITAFSIPTTNPAAGWYVMYAKCNMDNNTAAYSYYLTSSLDQTLQVANEGK